MENKGAGPLAFWLEARTIMISVIAGVLDMDGKREAILKEAFELICSLDDKQLSEIMKSFNGGNIDAKEIASKKQSADR